MKTLFLSDLDGTLLSPEKEITPQTAEILNHLLDRGLLFSYCTARSYHSAGALTRELHLSAPAVTHNGTFVVDPKTGRHLYTGSFSEEDSARLLLLLEREEVYPLTYFLVGEEEKVCWKTEKQSPGITRYLSTRGSDPRLMPVQGEFPAGRLYYITAIADYGTLERLVPVLREEGFTYNLQEEIYNRGEFWLEVMPGNITKASGARRVKEMTGADKLVCFGDNLNDAALFREADECYAVKNAVGVLRDMATGVIGSYEEDGVARWLEENAARFLSENE